MLGSSKKKKDVKEKKKIQGGLLFLRTVSSPDII